MDILNLIRLAGGEECRGAVKGFETGNVVPFTILVGRHQRSLVRYFNEEHRPLMGEIPGIRDMVDKFTTGPDSRREARRTFRGWSHEDTRP